MVAAMSTKMHRLPQDVLESQVSIIDLLIAMFPSSNELLVSPETLLFMEEVQQNNIPSSFPSSLSLEIYLAIDPEHSIQVNVSVPLESDEVDPAEPPPFSFSLRQPNWMNKASLAELSAALPEDIFSAIESIKDEAPRYISKELANETSRSNVDAPLVRVWFYFPSLSTREKRSDLVSFARPYSLTGFVLAGKPGVLCLEGGSVSIDTYMKEIKSVSWGDIPSHQKKVSERYREEGGISRVFDCMQEITDLVGERHGARANRGDMAALQQWLTERGLGQAFQKVIF